MATVPFEPLPAELAEIQGRIEGYARGYGLDFSGSARGTRFEKNVTFGHTGYTGTMFWLDPQHDCFFILLTNRVFPDDKADTRALRRGVATIVAEFFLGPKD